jgi:transcription elongation factor Elf1
MRVFQCAECGAENAVIELAAPAALRLKFCLHCGHSFADPEGAAVLQYTLLKHPSQDTLEDL